MYIFFLHSSSLVCPSVSRPFYFIFYFLGVWAILSARCLLDPLSLFFFSLSIATFYVLLLRALCLLSNSSFFHFSQFSPRLCLNISFTLSTHSLSFYCGLCVCYPNGSLICSIQFLPPEHCRCKCHVGYLISPFLSQASTSCTHHHLVAKVSVQCGDLICSLSHTHNLVKRKTHREY